MPHVDLRRLPVAALAAILAAPAAMFFLSAIGRSLQPVPHEPARTLDALVTWFVDLAAPWLVVLLIVMPAVAVAIALAVLWRALASDPGARADLVALGRSVQAVIRRPTLIVTALVVAFGALYFGAITIHAIAG